MSEPENTKQRCVQLGGREGAKQLMANSPSASRTLTWHDIPEWRQENEYIRAGYRPLQADYVQVIRSLTFLHNETGNVYTHLVGAVLLPIFASTIFRTICRPQYIGVTAIDFIMFGVFFCSAELCLAFSTLYHLIGCHSHAKERLLNL